MRNYHLFYYYADCLLLENDAKPNEEVLKKMNISMVEYQKAILTMGYLEFLYFSATKENDLINKLYGLIVLSLRKEEDKTFTFDVGYDDNNKAILTINGEIYSSKDFDEIRMIISEYNDIKLPNMNTQKEIREAIKKKKKISSGNSKQADIEDLIVALSSSTGFELEYIYNLSIRKFSKMLERVDAKLHYTMYATASMSGMVDFKDKSFVSKHYWLADLKTDELDDILISLDSVKENLSPDGIKK